MRYLMLLLCVMLVGCKSTALLIKYDKDGAITEYIYQELTGLGKKKVDYKKETFENDTGFKAGTPESILSVDIGKIKPD